MKKLLAIILVLCTFTCMLASCELINSILPSSNNENGENNKNDNGVVQPTPKETVKENGLTFTLVSDRRGSVQGYLLKSADKGPSEYVVPSEVEGLPVIEVASGAFKNHLALKKVTLPDSILVMNQGIFEGCKYIEELVLPYIASEAGFTGGNATTCIGYYFNEGDYSGSRLDWTVSDALFGEARVEYYIPVTLKKLTVNKGPLGADTFSGAKLTEVHLGAGIKFIDTAAFEYRGDLEKVTFDAPITSVGTDAFNNCLKLKTIKLTGDTLWIGRDAFRCCYDLEWVILSAGTTSIGNYAFGSCHDLSKIYYLGTNEDFEKIETGNGNTDFEEATLYIYSENEPTEDGNFWHYDEAGNPIEW